MFVFFISFTSAYDYTYELNGLPQNMTRVDAIINNTEVTFPLFRYDLYCNNIEQGNCTQSNFESYIHLEAERYIDNWMPEVEEETEINGNMVVAGYVQADGFYDGTAGIEDKTIVQYVDVLGAIENNQDGTLNDSTLPSRWKVLINGFIKRDISTMNSDFIGLFYKLVLGHQKQQQEIDTIQTETCQLNNGFSWC